jgi:subtilisin family serine protease
MGGLWWGAVCGRPGRRHNPHAPLKPESSRPRRQGRDRAAFAGCVEILEDRVVLSGVPLAGGLDLHESWREQSYALAPWDLTRVTPVGERGAAETQSAASGGALIGLPQVFSTTSYRGAGYSVAVIDTGIDYTGAALGGGWGHRVIAGYDFVNHDNDPLDDNGHGTHVAGIIGSSDATYGGVAPDVDLIALKVLDASGSGTFGAVEDALQWVVAHQQDYKIAAVNLSLGEGNYTTSPYTFLDDEFASLKSQGVFVSVASGNGFYSSNSQTGLSYPAVSPDVVSVGAVWTGDFGQVAWSSGARDYSTAADRIVSFTQRGSGLDLLAPGAMITSTSLHGTFATLAGTSMASPFVAGAAVLLRQALEDTGQGQLADEDHLLALMQQTGVSVNDGDDENDNVVNTGLNFRRLNLAAAMQAVLGSANQAPVLTAISDQTLIANSDPLIVPLSASDPEGDSVSFSATIVPQSGLDLGTVAVAGTKLTITPAPGFLGSFQVVVVASDGLGSATQSFSVTVLPVPNQPPVLAPPADQVISMGGAGLLVTLAASDPEGDPMTFTGEMVVPPGINPGRLIFDANTLLVSPPTNFWGTFQVRINASDGRGSAMQAFAVTVVPTEVAVDFDAGTGALTINAASSLSLSIADSQGSVSLLVNGLYDSDLALVPSSSVRSIIVNGSEASDLVDLGGVTLSTFTGFVGATLSTVGGDDTLAGSDFADMLSAGDGNDSVRGGIGNDVLNGGSGNDTLAGGVNNDTLLGGMGDDLLNGDGGNDVLRGHGGNDTLLGGRGHDTLLGSGGNDSLAGDEGNDILNGGVGRDTLDGGDGNDGLAGGAGADSLSGGIGRDTLVGGGDRDTLLGGGGSDLLLGEDGNDLLNGQGGTDSVAGGVGLDQILNPGGWDILDESFSFSADWVFAV